jgi:hypothetical protein
MPVDLDFLDDAQIAVDQVETFLGHRPPNISTNPYPGKFTGVRST